MNLGKIDSFVFFGGGITLLEIARWCSGNGHDVSVFTAPRHAAELVGEDSESLQDALEASGIAVYASENINEEPRLSDHVTDSTLGIAIGPAWIFRDSVLKLFDGRLVNFHGIPLPRVRGGAHYTWQILMGDRVGGCNIQLIERRLDAGLVIKTLEYRLPEFARVPQDYFDEAHRHDVPFVRQFVEDVLEESDFEPNRLQESFATYFPRLHSLQHGWIDWSCSTAEIERFICAFDDPYSGASTLLDGRRVFLKACSAEYDDGAFHPFQSGLIYRTSQEYLSIATRDGALLIGSMLSEDGQDARQRVRVGARLHTPREQLEAARSVRAVYDAKGLQSSETHRRSSGSS